MKITVLSDSHGDTEALLRAAAVEGPDMILHLGDYDRDCAALRNSFPQIPLRAVRGNCDRGSREIECDEFVTEGKRIFMTHGHLFGVKTGLYSILDEASARGADILLFGHTHRPFFEEMDGIYVINPGSVAFGRKTYAVLELGHGAVNCEIKSVGMWK